MSKHSIRSGSDSRFSASRSSSSASARRARRVAAAAFSDDERLPRVLRRELREAALLAAQRAPHLDARAAPLGQELLERGEVAGLVRHDDLRRHRRRRAVVLDAERLEHGGHVLLLDVLEVERVAVDHLAAAEREDLHDAVVALEREPEHVDVARRRGDRPPAARRGAGSRRAGCGSAPLPRSAPPPPPRASAARARAGSASVSPERNCTTPSMIFAYSVVRDVADAGRVAAVDVVVEARDAGVAARLRPLARAEAERRG